MRIEDFGACYSCRHWTLRTSDERHMETLPGEHPHSWSLGDCAIDGDVWIGLDTCDEYARRDDPEGGR